ncbi:hypothetical protein CDL15_Pgr011368 [Punica granatum]|uniref:Uncharacterized protein n=1 Tax=Punica granatum TaxID=22663 RepID=A0A218WG81_PUNGR|nr:hypothetical protein CDL15_Pgr011368 [Punica granatum]
MLKCGLSVSSSAPDENKQISMKLSRTPRTVTWSIAREVETRNSKKEAFPKRPCISKHQKYLQDHNGTSLARMQLGIATNHASLKFYTSQIARHHYHGSISHTKTRHSRHRPEHCFLP